METRLKTFSCPNCASNVQIRAQGISISFICSSCGFIINESHGDYSLANTAIINKINLQNIIIPIGKRGKIQGVTWEVIGYMRRQDVKWDFTWDEYLLFNPYQGFRFLIHSDGHFALANTMHEAPGLSRSVQNFKLNDHEFKLYHRGTARVISALGEFYWRVKVGDRISFYDYIAPPYSITMEIPAEFSNKNREEKNQLSSKTLSYSEYLANKSQHRQFNIHQKNREEQKVTDHLINQEVNFSIAEYLNYREIVSTFDLKRYAKPKKVYPSQPNPYGNNLFKIWSTFIFFFVIMFASQIIIIMNLNTRYIFTYEKDWQPSERGTDITLGEFKLDKATQNIQIESLAPVDNSWAEIEYEIVKDNSDESAWLIQPVEYYHGVEGGESWSEGAKISSAIAGTLNAGTYKVIASVETENFSKNLPLNILTRISTDQPIWSNFLIGIFLLLLYPLYASLRSYNFELARWEESDYTPHTSAYSRDDD